MKEKLPFSNFKKDTNGVVSILYGPEDDSDLCSITMKFLLTILLLTVCNFVVEKSEFASFTLLPPEVKYHFKFPEEINNNYTSVKQTITVKKEQTEQSELSELFFDYMIEEIFPHWYGTMWDFNGYTNVPREGEIACGYFVSTTLKHIGLNLNRYKFAQQYSLNEVKTLDKNYRSFQNVSVDSVRTYCINNLKDGLYIVGLDNHVGYIVIKNMEMYFVHSDPFSGVRHEKAVESQMMNFSNNFYVGSISNNDELMQKWKNNTEIIVLK